jgi:oligopeptide transport system substrate-binding protein
MLHAEVGATLEGLYGEQSEEIAAQLAWHFSEAGKIDKAIHYLLLAGDQARLMYAYQEAVEFYQRAIVFLKAQGDFEHAARTLMKLGLTYHTAFEYQGSRRAYDEAFAMRQRERIARPSALLPATKPFRHVWVEPPTLDPTIMGDARSLFYIENIFSGLVELGTEYEIIPDVAESWEISDDGCRYIFHLRDDVYWSDGSQVTAEDFVFALKRTLNPATGIPTGAASLLYDVKGAQAYHTGEIPDPDQVGVRAVDTLTLDVELEHPASYFLHLLANRYPVPQHVVEAYGEAWTEPGNLVTNGPFLLESYLPGECITLVRNPAYHGRFPSNLQLVEMKLDVPMASSGALEMYESDDLDIAFLDEVTFPARHRYVEDYVSEPEPGTIFVGFDTSRPPFDDLRVRRAFVMSVDKERLVDEVLGGYYYPATGGLVPPVLPGHSPGIGLPYDPDQACHLLAKAGYPKGRGFSMLELVYWRLPNVLKYLKAQWLRNLNVDVTIEMMEYTKLMKEPRSSKLLCGGYFSDYPDPDNFLRVCVQRYVPHWRNETYERLLEDARRSSDQGNRVPLYQAADKILIEEAVIMPISHFTSNRLVKPWVKVPGRGAGIWYLKDVILMPH